MSIIANFFRSIFGRSNSFEELEIKFHKEANLYGRHGTLKASHVEHKLKGAEVRFVFRGLSSPPPLKPSLLSYIWEQAKAQGYTPEELLSYGDVLEITAGVELQDLTSTERKSGEVGFNSRETDRLPEATLALANVHMQNSLSGAPAYIRNAAARNSSSESAIHDQVHQPAN